uniref:Uncharacterized protein n=1 Tax=Anguilla anguilla TaxID=7936 RepID=A0A0E9P7V9_ANGAN
MKSVWSQVLKAWTPGHLNQIICVVIIRFYSKPMSVCPKAA